MENKKNPVGKPPWIPTKETYKKIEKYGARGLNKEQIAACLGVSYNCLHEKARDFPELDEALKRGKALGINKVARALLKNVKEKNVTAQIFYLKTQGGWREQDLQDKDDEKRQLLESVKEIVSKCLKEV